MHPHTLYGTRIRRLGARRIRREGGRGGAASTGNEQMRRSKAQYSEVGHRVKRAPRAYVEERTWGLTNETLKERCDLTLNYNWDLPTKDLFHLSSKRFNLVQLPFAVCIVFFAHISSQRIGESH